MSRSEIFTQAIPASMMALAILLTGCGTGTPSASTTQVVTTSSNGIGTIKVQILGGSRAIVGASLNVYAVGTGGYGTASTLLSPAPIVSDANGAATITGTSCTSGQQIYVTVKGGDGTATNAGANTGTSLMAVLGPCPTSGSLSAVLPTITVNEVTTVAAAYALAGYATDYTHIANSGTSRALATQGTAIAVANAGQLASVTSGAALAVTPGGNGTPPQALLNTLANVLAACVETNSPTSTACSTLFSNALASGKTGTAPTDTATAAINIVHYPAVSTTVIAALYKAGATGPFTPALAAVPNDFTAGIVFTGGGLAAGASTSSHSVAIDGSGNAWVTNSGGSLSEFSPLGIALSPATGFTGGGLTTPFFVSIDLSGNVWVSNYPSSSVAEFTSAGKAITPTAGYTGGGISEDAGNAIDGNGNFWTANALGNTISEFKPTGTPVSATGFTGGGINGPSGLAIDSSENVWVCNYYSGTVSKFASATGAAISPANGYGGGGPVGSSGIAIDNAQNIWTGTYAGGVSEYSNAGVPISTGAGFTAGSGTNLFSIAIDGTGDVWLTDGGGSSLVELFSNNVSSAAGNGSQLTPTTGYKSGAIGASGPSGIAIDGSGDVWTGTGTSVTEVIGAAAPVVTPLVVGTSTLTLGARP